MGIVLKKKDARIAPNVTKKLAFVDVIESMIDSGVHTNNEVIEMVGLMQNEMDRIKSRHSAVAGYGNDDDEPPKYLDYEELFKLFILKRRITLLRFLFTLDRKVFDFHADLFLKALEHEAYDMAALLFKEFFKS